MDAQAKKKALYRAKLKDSAQKREKRIDSPLVRFQAQVCGTNPSDFTDLASWHIQPAGFPHTVYRYNEYDQPVCRVCDVTLKSESLWPAHQASRKHHEAIQNIKANAAGSTRINEGKSEPPTEFHKSKSEPPKELPQPKSEAPKEFHKPRLSSVLPEGFFDNPETKRQKAGLVTGGKSISSAPQASVKLVDSDSSLYEYGKVEDSAITRPVELSNLKSSVTVVETEGRSEVKPSSQLGHSSRRIDGSEVKQVKGALPEGFFDNKDADLRARGIEPVKPDIKDEYKEFEKVIQGDLKEVDDRLEEEEFDAAEMIEGAESLEQKSYWQKVEMLKKKQMELKAAKSAEKKVPVATRVEPSNEESSSDEDENDGNFAVDWRAKHL